MSFRENEPTLVEVTPPEEPKLVLPAKSVFRLGLCNVCEKPMIEHSTNADGVLVDCTERPITFRD